MRPKIAQIFAAACPARAGNFEPLAVAVLDARGALKALATAGDWEGGGRTRHETGLA